MKSEYFFSLSFETKKTGFLKNLATRQKPLGTGFAYPIQSSGSKMRSGRKIFAWF